MILERNNIINSILFEKINFDPRNQYNISRLDDTSRIVRLNQNNKVFAIKIHYMRMNDSLILVENEIKILIKLHYCSFLPKSLPKFYGFYRENGDYFIFLDFFQKSLREYMNNENILDFKTIKKFFFQLIKALAFLQALRIAHRDIKPENIMITNEENVVIVDFNMADILHDNDQIKTAWRGTDGYKSPEWIESDLGNLTELEVNLFKADAYSLGLVVLEMGKVFNLNQNKKYNNIDEISERKRKWLRDFKEKYKDTDDEEKNIVFSLLTHCLKIKANERMDFIDLFSELMKMKYEEISNSRQDIKRRFKYHIIIDDYQDLEFFGENERNAV